MRGCAIIPQFVEIALPADSLEFQEPRGRPGRDAQASMSGQSHAIDAAEEIAQEAFRQALDHGPSNCTDTGRGGSALH